MSRPASSATPPVPPSAPAPPSSPVVEAGGWLWPALLLGSIAGALLQLMQPALWPARVYAALLLAGVAAVVLARRLGRRRRGPAAHALPASAPQWLAFCAMALAAFAVCGLRAGAYLSDALDPALEGRDLRIVAVVAAMPQPTDAGVRLRLEVESAWLAEQGGGRPRSGDCARSAAAGRTARRRRAVPAHAMRPSRPVRLPPLVDVSWSSGAPWFARQADGTRTKARAAAASVGMPDAALAPSSSSPAPVSPPVPAARVGERWEMTVRLNAPHGLRNPGGFDAELWLWEQGVQATGSVQAGARAGWPVRLEAAPWWRHPVEQARQRVRDAILARLAPPQVAGADTDSQDLARRRAAGVVATLVTGDQRAIDRADWDVFRATGVAHLVSISGLHITLFAWVAAAVVGWLWRRSALLCLSGAGALGGAGGRGAAGGGVCAVQRLGGAGAAHGVHAGGGRRAAAFGAALALAAGLAAGLRGGGGGRSVGAAAGGLLAQLRGGGRAVRVRRRHAARGGAGRARGRTPARTRAVPVARAGW